MIGVRLAGGLGNQMFQYAAGLRLATRHDTQLVLDLSRLQERTACTPRAFGLHCFRVRATRTGTPRLLPSSEWAGRARALFRRIREPRAPLGMTLWPERGYAFDEAVLQAPDAVCLEGYWQSEKYFHDVEPLVRAHFSFAEEPDGDVRRWIGEIARCESVAVHVRRGDYVSTAAGRRFHGVLPLDYYAKAAGLIAAQVRNPHFFVVSDDPPWCRQHFRIPHPVTVVEGARSASEDLRLIRSCRHHVIANSAFSWWGAWLADPPSRLVVAPERWFLTPELDTKDLIPPGWLRV